jgi:putative ABC transport system substrate-binding protein
MRDAVQITRSNLTRFAIAPLAIATFWLVASCNNQASDHPRIAIIYTQPYPVLNDAIAGIKEIVLGKFPNAEFFERHANGRPEEYGATVLAAINWHPTVLAPLTTQISSIAIDQSRGAIPVVFTAVTDPLGAHIVKSLEHPELSTGSSDLCPFASLLQTAREVSPSAKTLGLPYNPTDQPAVFGRQQLLSLAPRYGFTIADQQISSLTDLASSVGGLASRTDAIIISSDNMMMENAASVASAAAEHGKATYACDSGSVGAGAVAGVEVNYREVGRLSGQLIVQVIQGARPGDLPVAVVNSGGLALNLRAACAAHVSLLPAVISRATKVIDPDYRCPTVN